MEWHLQLVEHLAWIWNFEGQLKSVRVFKSEEPLLRMWWLLQVHSTKCDEGYARQDQVGSPDYTCIAWSSSQYHQWQKAPCSNLHKQPNMVQACLHNSVEGKQSAWFSTKEPQWLQLQSQSSYHHGQTHPAVCSLYLRPISPEGHPATWTGSTQGCQIHIQELLWQNTTARLRLGKTTREKESKQACHAAQDQQGVCWHQQTATPGAPKAHSNFPKKGADHPALRNFFFPKNLREWNQLPHWHTRAPLGQCHPPFAYHTVELV